MSGKDVLGKKNGICKGPVAGGRSSCSGTKCSVYLLCRKHRDLLREVMDDKEIRENRSQQAKASQPPAEDYSHPVGAPQAWFFLKQPMKILA